MTSEINTPLISIIVPVYNIEKYISKCIDSILAQTYKNIEVIIIDDGSIDSTSYICNTYCKRFENIKFFRINNAGVSHARNIGLNHANGEFVCFIDGDDYISPYYIEKMLNVSMSNDSDIVLCDYDIVDPNENKINIISNGKQYNKTDLFSDMTVSPGIVEELYYKNRFDCAAYIVVWNKLYKRSIFKNLKFNEFLSACEDEYIFSDLLRACKQISFIKDKLYYYVQTNIGLSTKDRSDNGFDNITIVFDHRINTYTEEKNVKLQSLCCNKYLRQTITCYHFLSKQKKRRALNKYLDILKKYPASKIFLFLYPIVPLLSFLKSQL